MFNLMPWKKKQAVKKENVSGVKKYFPDRWLDGDILHPSTFFREHDLFPSIDVKEGKKMITVKAA